MSYLDQLIGLLRGNQEQSYTTPKTPSFEVMQQVAVPNYKLNEINGPVSSFINTANPNVANINTNQYFNPNPEFSKTHEIQHQIEAIAKKKGQIESNNPINDAWHKNANELGYNGYSADEYLRKKLSNPDVQQYFKDLGAKPNSRILNAQKAPFDEILADLSAWQTKLGKDITSDPFLQKKVFNDEKLNKLIQSTTGMSGVVIGDSDYEPYSLESAEAWNKPTRKSILEKLFK